MYTNLLWATDGSEGAEAALHEALRLLEPGGRLIAFHCDQRSVGSRAGGFPVFADEAARRGHLRDRVEELVAEGIDAELVVESTRHSPAHAIVDAAERYGVDAIVCGAPLQHARVPVLVVPSRVAARA